MFGKSSILLAAVCCLAVQAFGSSTMPSKAKVIQAYVKGLRVDVSGDTYVVLDNSQAITPISTTYTIGTGSMSEFVLYVGNCNSNNIVKTVTASLLAAKAAGDLVDFSLNATIYGTYNCMSSCVPHQ